MPIVKTAKFKGQDVEVRELTVAQLDEILTPADMSTIDRMFDDELITERMMVTCTGIKQEELRSSHPSDLRPLVDAVKEVNPDFLSGMTRLAARRSG